MKSKINDDALFIIGATGSQFDIGYLDLINKNNIVYDYSNILEKKGFLANSGFILIENKKIDTIIALEAKNLEAQLTYIEKKLLTQ
ncbi:MAG TPA: hypothetical protein VLB74_05780 [Flavobacterium sp.]|uniref:hypothetical protein n=1 Tax=Flavobacterium sp. TaxID=239 RepID=UPI002CA19CEB|nr:hypothetical protein [Flavobacterium sp.]HSD14136.1 hypothetical protein [Flavobacterium sp.]